MKAQSGEHDGQDLRVLLVEDNQAESALLEQAFEDLGIRCEVKSIDSGERALAHLIATDLRGGPPALVLLDLCMPGMDGEAVLEALRRDHSLRTLPVVVWTSSSDAEMQTRVRRLGVHSLLAKPSNLDGYSELARRLAAIVRTRK